MFLHYNKVIINPDIIDYVDCADLAQYNRIIIHFKNEKWTSLEGQEAFNLVMRLCPDALEGGRIKYARHAWAIHNLLGHPLMQILSWLGLSRLGIKIHDATTPFPITKEQ